MTLAEALRGVTRIGVDSSAFIDYSTAAPRSIRTLTRVVERLSAGALEGVTTVLTLTEVLTYARVSGKADAEQRKAEEDFEALLGAVRIVAVTEAIARRAVDLRTRYRLATPDAVQLGTALEAGCQAFLTSDAGDFLRVAGEIRVIVPAKLTDG